MLAQTYDSKKAFKTPCVVQPKLDGVRAYYIEGVFRSRNHKVYYNMEHLSKVLSKVKDSIRSPFSFNIEISFNLLNVGT